MIKNALVSILLIVSIALQSFATIASASESHQIDTQHLQTEHSHTDDQNIFSEKSSSSELHDIKDCHHCDHCSGSHLTWVAMNLAFDSFKIYTQESYIYSNSSQVAFREAALRPPIS